MKTLDDKLRLIEEVISDEAFRKTQGLSNEVGYYI